MQQTWVYLVLLYGIIKGVREIFKKKAMEQSGVIEVLFFYTLIGFLLVIPTAHHLFDLPSITYFFIFIKSFVIFVAWICAFHSIRKLPISLYGVMDLARMVFSTLLGILCLGERMTWGSGIGFLLVISGLILVNRKQGSQNSEVQTKFVWLTLISSFLNAVSAMLDKVLMKDLESGQLQFWYMLFLAILYLCYLLFSRTKINWKTIRTNYWIPILSIIFIFADRILFIANADPGSRVTVMTLIKQCSVFVTILLGKLVYREKNVLYRALCAVLILAGIFCAVVL